MKKRLILTSLLIAGAITVPITTISCGQNFSGNILDNTDNDHPDISNTNLSDLDKLNKMEWGPEYINKIRNIKSNEFKDWRKIPMSNLDKYPMYRINGEREYVKYANEYIAASIHHTQDLEMDTEYWTVNNSLIINSSILNKVYGTPLAKKIREILEKYVEHGLPKID